MSETASTPPCYHQGGLLSRRQWLCRSVVISATAAVSAASAPFLSRRTSIADELDSPAVPTWKDTFGLLEKGRKIPVIFDTDIGGDIDDTWALVFLMKCPELDVKLLVADAGNTTYRARLMAKMMEAFNRRDMPIGIGVMNGDGPGNQSKWLGDYQLSQYDGPIHKDGVQSMIDTIHASADPVTVVAIGGVPTVAEALRRDPTIVQNARFVGMHGSIYRGYGDGSKPVPEANVRTDPQALATVFKAPWECSITPLDTCDRVTLKGEKYQRVYTCQKPEVRALIENYEAWSVDWIPPGLERSKRSSTLFDLVAVYMAFSEELLKMRSLPLDVTDDGMTVVDSSRRPVRCAVDWNDLSKFEDLIVQRITA
jgi:inosine-uridine nucleoside N-ribohydrolase